MIWKYDSGNTWPAASNARAAAGLQWRRGFALCFLHRLATMRRACSSALCICMKEQSPTRYPRKVPWSPESCHVRLAHHLLQNHVIACSPQSSPFNYKSIHSKPARTSNINNLHPIPQPPTPLKHHSSIHKNRALPAQPPAPNPLPNNSFHPIENHKPQIHPQPQIT